MDYSTLIAFIVAVAALYLFAKWVLSPLMKSLLGIIFFIAVIYILQNFFNLQFTTLISPLNKYFTGWGVFNPINIINNIWEYISSLLGNVSK